MHRIILDIDDTLNSLTLFLMGRIFGCPVSDFDYDKFPKQCGYNIVEAVRTMTGVSYEVPQFWNMVTREMWANAPKSREFNFILNASCHLVGKENVYLASTPTKDPEAHAGKVEWINKHMPEDMRRQYFITPRKWLLAQPGVCLIDDCDDNVSKFRAEGGKALLVPRPWNSASGHHTLDTLTSALRR